MYISLYHGEYPYVTSKDVTASAACSDVGIGPKNVDEVIVVFKSYVTRVGAGPLENEISEEEINKKGWSEFGTVTGWTGQAAFSGGNMFIQVTGANETSISWTATLDFYELKV